MRKLMADRMMGAPGRRAGGVGVSRLFGAGMLALSILLAALLAALPFGSGALAAEDRLFVVGGIAVDETAEDATRAKMRAIMRAQRRAFMRLVRRLAGERAARRLAGVPDRTIGRLLSSLSITGEQTAPTRYIANITIRFDAAKMTRFLRKAGIAYTTRQAPPVLVVPVWRGEEGPKLWEENPWLAAWRALADENALVPVLIPVGDDVDRNAITALQAEQGDKAALQALRLRYGTDHVLVAIARPVGDNAVQAAMMGRSPGGRLLFDKTYEVPQGGLPEAAREAVSRFMEVMTMKWRRKVLREARQRAAEQAREQAARARGVTVVVPFSSLREWQQLRARLISTPGIAGVDVQALSGSHAVVRLATQMTVDGLQQALATSRLLLRHSGGKWYLQAY